VLYKILKSYQSLPKNFHLLFYLEFSVSLIHVAFILILNIFLRKKGFSDPEIASLNSLRFISALIFAIPLGIYIRGKKLKPFFISSAIMVPLTSILIIQSIHFDINFLIKFSFLLWGLGIMLMRVCSLPFIIRSSNSNNSTEALSLIAATWSLSTIISGLIISGSSWINNLFFVDVNYLDERKILLLITLIGMSGIYFSLKIDEKKPLFTEKSNFLDIHKNYDWKLIFKAISPLILISIGAGLTIPFVNLFFNSIFNLTSSQFSIMGSLTGILVFLFSLSVPSLRKKFGYWMTIVIVQSIAILCLVLMALTEIYADYEIAIVIAISAYVLRQPLMHMAHPASNELMMNYVGEKNQELISALSSSLWSASWFFSAKIFEWLRVLNYNYYKIFLITALLYTIGVILFSILIKDYNKRIVLKNNL
jgi:hypothetical protein